MLNVVVVFLVVVVAAVVVVVVVVTAACGCRLQCLLWLAAAGLGQAAAVLCSHYTIQYTSQAQQLLSCN